MITPTVGRIVHFYPNDYDVVDPKGTFYNKMNTAKFLAAIVTQVANPKGSPYEDMVNLSVFTPFDGVIQVGSINHKDKASKNSPYWEWPPRD